MSKFDICTISQFVKLESYINQLVAINQGPHIVLGFIASETILKLEESANLEVQL